MCGAARCARAVWWWASDRTEKHRSVAVRKLPGGEEMGATGFGEAAEQLRRATVLVQSGKRGNGSGIVWSGDGTIVTNAHVVDRPHVRVELWDGREFAARVASRDVRRDIAALRIEAGGLPAAPIGDSSRVRPGQLASAIGNPLGFVGALTTGVIHAV